MRCTIGGFRGYIDVKKTMRDNYSLIYREISYILKLLKQQHSWFNSVLTSRTTFQFDTPIEELRRDEFLESADEFDVWKSLYLPKLVSHDSKFPMLRVNDARKKPIPMDNKKIPANKL